MIGKSAMAMLAAAALALTACALPKPDPKAEALAKTVYDQVRHGDDAAVIKEMAPEAQSPALKDQLAQIRSFIPPGEPKSATLSGWNFFTDLGKGDSATLTYAYDYGDKTTNYQVTLVRPKGAADWLVRGFHVETHAAGEQPQAAPPPPAVSGGGEPQAPPPPDPSKTKS